MSILLADPIAAADRSAIDAIRHAQAEAWNRHDMAAFCEGMTADVDWVNVVGMHWRGRDAVERAHAALHRLPLFKDSRMVPGEAEMRALTPDAILVVEKSRIEGAGPTPDGSPYPPDGAMLSLIFVRTDAGWRLAHGHNTNINARAVAHDPAQRPG